MKEKDGNDDFTLVKVWAGDRISFYRALLRHYPVFLSVRCEKATPVLCKGAAGGGFGAFSGI